MTPDTFLDETKHLGKPLRHYLSLESTNDLAQELARDLANHGTVVLADFQTRGRGQYGRVWQAPPESSLLMSVLVFPPPEVFRPVLLTALAAVSVCETLQAFERATRIKWPNDVLAGERKICGTLIECGQQPRPWAVIGLGLNLNQTQEDFGKLSLPDATSLGLLTGQRHTVIGTARSLLARLDAWYDRLLNSGEGELETVWRERVGLVGRRVRLTIHPERERVGMLRELSFDGIVLETADGEVESHRPEVVRRIAGA
jgi:BirA family transcriptional regulator, biotin operon repressor / biotin---[acetyl-CoA-carboxylase] ligase